jgi:8-oxo-dGTP pyrophosphatase MutT (NUDIX family)
MPTAEGFAAPQDDANALRTLLAERLAGFAARRRDDAGVLKRAAVALTVVAPDPSETASEAVVLLTKRTPRLRAHGGQLALPGGRVDPGETVEAAALRELHEELGIALDPAAIIGMLDDYPTRSGYLISPIVAWAPPGTVATPNPTEVARLFRIPLSELRRTDSLEIFAIPESDRPVLRLHLTQLDGHVNTPTAAILYQFREVALEGRATRVDHFDQPVWAWR